jgi:hypothetical protein
MLQKSSQGDKEQKGPNRDAKGKTEKSESTEPNAGFLRLCIFASLRWVRSSEFGDRLARTLAPPGDRLAGTLAPPVAAEAVLKPGFATFYEYATHQLSTTYETMPTYSNLFQPYAGVPHKLEKQNLNLSEMPEFKPFQTKGGAEWQSAFRSFEQHAIRNTTSVGNFPTVKIRPSEENVIWQWRPRK